MAVIYEDKDRKIVPRWRGALLTAALGELSTTLAPKRDLPNPEFLRKRREDWERNRQIAYATDLVSAAFVCGQESLAQDAAEFVVKNQDKATPSAVRIAKKVLGEDSSPTPENIDSRIMIRNLRRRTVQDPHNAIAWTDLALNYTIQGHPDKAERAIRTALSLAPGNRFILRSAARLYLHQDQPRIAHDILRRSEATKHDPWLLAAEIAIASISDRTSRWIKAGKELIDSLAGKPHHISELASAIATLELGSGSSRAAKKLFHISLIQPNENAVAQAGWASRQNRQLAPEKSPSNVPRTFEASSWTHFYKSNWKESLGAAKLWQIDQPFSTRPAIHGSFIAGALLQDFKESCDIVKVGLAANPEDFTLNNNYVFALINMGDLSGALTILDRMKRFDLTKQDEVVLAATSGLYHYRKGEREAGRSLYVQALDSARRLSIPKLEALVALFFAQEEIKAHTPTASDTVNLATTLGERVVSSDVKALVKFVGELFKKDALK